MTHGAVHFFKKCTRVLFGRHLVATNATISTVMGIVGDLVQQHYEVLSGRQAAINSVRTSHMAAAGLTTGMRRNFATNIRLTFAADIDPFYFSSGEAVCDVKCYFRIELTDIKDHLVGGTSFTARNKLKAYKSMDAHIYATSGWVQQH
ncbi:hypothetical protein HPB51_026189 [Rhipicephalus microplus]|uniref:Uncharacterized protein n=1 Tax=Rhipicephalus microplus TaxID=6941 RepID=A0A9J6DXR8_RHIMP|nr:hypothetical protein HPB51_026189 [Rhipicephalus microplus]